MNEGATSRRIVEPVASKKRASGRSVEPIGKADAAPTA